MTYTFFIMLICWGMCVICSLNGVTLNDNYLLYVPYLLGGWSPTIASFLSLKKSVLFHCIVNSLSGIYVINDNIWGNVITTILLILCSYIFIKGNERVNGVFN